MDSAIEKFTNLKELIGKQKPDVADHLLETHADQISHPSSAEVRDQFESLIHVRDSLIAEIEEHINTSDFLHMSEYKAENHLAESAETDGLDNFTYDVYTKHGKHIHGHTNQADSDPEVEKFLELAAEDQADQWTADNLVSLYQGLAGEGGTGSSSPAQ